MPDPLLSDTILLHTLRTGTGQALVLGGALISLAGATGILRFPDFYTRMHAASVSDTAAVALTLSGLALITGWSIVSVKIILICLFLFLTGPTGTHAAANAAFGSGLKPLAGEWRGNTSPH